MQHHELDTCAPLTGDTAAKTEAIRRLNDAFRQTATGGLIAVTRGIEALSVEDLRQVVAQIRERAEFTADNDPYGEHDMGTLTCAGERIFWKIDYYDADLDGGSRDPSDPAVTKRVLTIMLASEY